MTTRDAVGIAVLVVVALGILLAMRAGWRRRGRATGAWLGEPATVPADPGPAATADLAATYVSTTRAGEWLERVVAHGLGERSSAVVTVHATGVVVRRPGSRDLFLPAADVVGVEAAGGQAGKVVGGEGLLVLRWRGLAPSDAAGTADPDRPQLDTALRLRHRADQAVLADAVRALVHAGRAAPAAPAAPPTDPADPADSEEHA